MCEDATLLRTLEFVRALEKGDYAEACLQLESLMYYEIFLQAGTRCVILEALNKHLKEFDTS